MAAQSDPLNDPTEEKELSSSILQAQHDLLSPWIIQNIPWNRKILDIGCGTGILTNSLAKKGHRLTGIDISDADLNLARKHDETLSVRYIHANAYSLPFKDQEFDAVIITNVLEEIEEPDLLIGEASRVLKTKGLVFFHTQNRTIWNRFFKNNRLDENSSTIKKMIKPDELKEMCLLHQLTIQEITGLKPRSIFAFWKMPSFCFSHSFKISYCGFARKRESFYIPNMLQ